MKKALMWLLAMLMLSGSMALAQGNVNPHYGVAHSPMRYEESESGLTAEVSGATALALGAAGEWQVSAQGGEAPYSYQYYILTERGETYTYAHWSEDSAFSFEILSAGRYTLLANVRDGAGRTVSAEREIVVGGANGGVATMAGAVTVEQKVEQIVSECFDSVNASDEYEVALWLHDWLTMNAYYDETYSYYEPDGVLLKGKGVCDSYSKAYVLLLQKAGIGVERVTGGNHAWVIARIDGVWSHIDPTWDDPIDSSPRGPVSGLEGHYYFGVPDEFMRVDHTWSKATNCTSYDASYYIREGIVAEVLDFEAGRDVQTYQYSIGQFEAMIAKASAFPMSVRITEPYALVPTERAGRYMMRENASFSHLAAYELSQCVWEIAGVEVYLKVVYDGRNLVFDLDYAKLLEADKPTVTYTNAYEPVTVSIKIHAGTDNYAYIIYDDSGKVVAEYQNVDKPRATFTDLPEGNYVAFVTMTDDGNLVSSEGSDWFTLKMKPLEMAAPKFELSANRQSIFISKPKITGGTHKYTIAYNIYDDKGNAINYFYSDEARVAASPMANGTYNVFIVVRDGLSEVQKDIGWVTLDGYKEPQPLSMSDLTWEISSSKRDIFIDKPKITGGTETYKIAYNIYDDKGNAVNYFYSNASRVAASPGANGKYNVFVVVDDGATKVQKDIGWVTLTGYKANSVLDGEEAGPTAEPTVEPTAEPTVEPTVEPTAEPTVEPTTLPAPEVKTVRTYMRVIEDRTPLREDPDDSADEIARFDRRDVVYVEALLTYGDGTGWALVAFDDEWGYIDLALLEEMTDAEIAAYLASLEPAQEPEEPEWEPEEETAQEPDEEPAPAQEPEEEPVWEPEEPEQEPDGESM